MVMAYRSPPLAEEPPNIECKCAPEEWTTATALAVPMPRKNE